MPELCQWVININYLAARLRQIYSKPAARFICMVKTNCRNLAVGLQQSSSKLAARSPLALPQGLFFGKGVLKLTSCQLSIKNKINKKQYRNSKNIIMNLKMMPKIITPSGNRTLAIRNMR